MYPLLDTLHSNSGFVFYPWKNTTTTNSTDNNKNNNNNTAYDTKSYIENVKKKTPTRHKKRIGWNLSNLLSRLCKGKKKKSVWFISTEIKENA